MSSTAVATWSRVRLAASRSRLSSCASLCRGTSGPVTDGFPPPGAGELGGPAVVTVPEDLPFRSLLPVTATHHSGLSSHDATAHPPKPHKWRSTSTFCPSTGASPGSRDHLLRMQGDNSSDALVIYETVWYQCYSCPR